MLCCALPPFEILSPSTVTQHSVQSLSRLHHTSCSMGTEPVLGPCEVSPWGPGQPVQGMVSTAPAFTGLPGSCFVRFKCCDR